MRPHQWKGFSLAATILVGLACLAVAFCIAALATMQMNATQRAVASEKTFYLAQGVVALALERIHAGLSILPSPIPYGIHTETLTYSPYPDRPDAQGQISFDPKTTWGYSTANYSLNSTLTGWNNTNVGPGMIHLVARGIWGGTSVVRTLEVMVSVPQYNYVLSVQGPLDASADRLLVASEPCMPALYQDGGFPPCPPPRPIPANLGSGTSVRAGANTIVTGDIVVSSTPTPDVSLGPCSVVDGVTRAGPVQFPSISITSVPGTGYKSWDPLPAVSSTTMVLNTNAYVSPTLTPVSLPNLQLNNAALFVDGDLQVQSLTGSGAVYVHGNATIGGADLGANNMVALLASGNVTLAGKSSSTSYFQGLVYTEGVFSAASITIAGAFVAAPGPDNPGGATALKLQSNVRVVWVPPAATLTFQPPAVSIGCIDPGGRRSCFMYGAGAPPQPRIMLLCGCWAPCSVSPDTPADTILYEAVQAAASPPVPQAGGGGAGAVRLFCYCKGGSVVFVQSITYCGSANRFVAVPTPWCGAVVNCQTVVSGSLGGLSHCNPALLCDFDKVAPPPPPTARQVIQALVNVQTAFMNAANALLAGDAPAPNGLPNLSLNRFLADQNSIHIVSWRER